MHFHSSNFSLLNYVHVSVILLLFSQLMNSNPLEIDFTEPYINRLTNFTPWFTNSPAALTISAKTLSNALRNQRDLRGSVPLHRVIWPGISLSQTVFAGGNFTTDRINSIEGLLLSGFRRIVIDLYWDARLIQWQVCPSVIWNSTGLNQGSILTTVTLPSTTFVSSVTPSVTTSTAISRPTETEDLKLNNNLVCSSTDDVDKILKAVKRWMTATSVDVNSDIGFIIFNLNDLKVDPLPPNATTTTVFPTVTTNSANLSTTISITSTVNIAQPTPYPALSEKIRRTFENSVFTPELLKIHRANPAAYWRDSLESKTYNLFTNATAQATSSNGWPSTFDLLSPLTPATPRRRVLFGFGRIQTEESNILFKGYNLTQDSDTIFESELMNFDSESSLSLQSVSSFQTKPTSSSPSVTSPFPCLQLGSITINSTGTESLRFPQVPNSPPFSPSKTLSPKYISLSDNPPLINFTYDTILQSSQCGLSPFIKSLPPSMPLSPPILEQGGTPAMNLGTIGKFGEYVAGTLWSWDVLQPVNGSVSNCALIWIETGGRWKVGNCSETNFLACQSKNDPHDWTFTSARSSWHDANTKTQSSRERSCSENYFFSVPKTPLQNYFLLTKMIEKNIEKAWLNYADLSTDGCWVEGGGKCRYADEDATIQQIINVTIIGGILVLIIVAVFLYFRCRRYLRVSKGQRRRNDVRERLKYVEVAGFPA